MIASPPLMKVAVLLASQWIWLSLGQGQMDEEKLLVSNGNWHRAQRKRVGFGTSCYFTNEPELPHGCQYEIAGTTTWQTTVRNEEKAVLLNLWSLTGGSVGGWLSDDNWGEGDPCWDSWYGVTCDEHGFVIELDLSDNRLAGILPSNFDSLTHLLRLDLSSTADQHQNHPNEYRNRLTGDLPSFGNCLNLEEIEVSGNLFDALPADLYLNAGTLRSLSASYNRIRHFPNQLRRFTQLHTLELTHNVIEDFLPSDLGALTNLRFVRLQYNSMVGEMPAAVTGLSKVRVFDVSHNPYLSGELPEDIIVTWSDVDYISLLNTTMSGYIAALCLDVPFCWRFMYDTHADLTWATAADVPDIVYIVRDLATAASLGQV